MHALSEGNSVENCSESDPAPEACLGISAVYDASVNAKVAG